MVPWDDNQHARNVLAILYICTVFYMTRRSVQLEPCANTVPKGNVPLCCHGNIEGVVRTVVVVTDVILVFSLQKIIFS